MGLRVPLEKTKETNDMRIIISGEGKIPSKKNRMRVYGNRMVKDKGVKDFETELRLKALTIMSALDISPISEPVSLHLKAVQGDKRRRDVQNYFGSVCDALNGVVYDDDSQIEKISAEKVFNKGIFCYSIIIEIINKQDKDDGPTRKEEGDNLSE